MVKSGEPPPPLVIMMDPPEHRRMRSLINKVFTPRAINAQHDTVDEVITGFLRQADPSNFDAVQDFSLSSPSKSSPACLVFRPNTVNRCGTG